MFHQTPQHFDLQDNAGDPSSWLSGEDHHPSSPSFRRTLSALSNAAAASAGTVDPALYKDLVQMVPLVQSLIDRKQSTSFTRRGSMIYTKTPSRESLSRKARAQSIPPKKGNDVGNKNLGKNGNDQDGGVDGFSMFSSSALTEKDKEELVALREQVEELQKKLLEKDECLKSVEISKKEMSSVYGMLEELKSQSSEKDILLKSTQVQLSDAKIKLADKQAALEKLQWEAVTSNKQVEKLQGDIDTVEGEMSSFMLLFKGLSRNNYSLSAEEYDVKPYASQLPDIDDMGEVDMRKMEDAREAYIAAVAAVAAAKEKQDEESMALATRARLHLQSFVLRTN